MTDASDNVPRRRIIRSRRFAHCSERFENRRCHTLSYTPCSRPKYARTRAESEPPERSKHCSWFCDSSPTTDRRRRQNTARFVRQEDADFTAGPQVGRDYVLHPNTGYGIQSGCARSALRVRRHHTRVRVVLRMIIIIYCAQTLFSPLFFVRFANVLLWCAEQVFFENTAITVRTGRGKKRLSENKTNPSVVVCAVLSVCRTRTEIHRDAKRFYSSL